MLSAQTQDMWRYSAYSSMMVFNGLLCTVMLCSNLVIANTSTCMPRIRKSHECGLRDVWSCFRKLKHIRYSGSHVKLSGRSLNCNPTSLSHEVSMLLPNDLITLTVNAYIESIDPGILHKFHKLHYLCLAHNHIKSVSSNIFLNLTHLVKLDLGYNQIE